MDRLFMDEEMGEYFPISCDDPDCIVSGAHFASDCHTAEDMEQYYCPACDDPDWWNPLADFDSLCQHHKNVLELMCKVFENDAKAFIKKQVDVIG